METTRVMAAAKAVARQMFERFADIAVAVPPVLRRADPAKYSADRLDFALNNGLALTRKGRLWASWISGGDGPDSFTAISWSDDGGETWSDTKFVIDGHDGAITGRTNIIGTFWLDPDGKLRCFTDQSVLHFDGRAGVWESVCLNPDDPEPKWRPFRRIGDGHLMNKPIVLGNGDWAASVYLNGTWDGRGTLRGAFPRLDAVRGAICYVSTDKGKNWEQRGCVVFPRNADGCEDWQESQLLESPDGTLRVFARVCDGETGRLMSAESADGGRTWTKPHALPGMDSPNARCQIRRLASGRLLFVKNGAADKGAPAWGGRERMTAYLSDDEGATWRGGLLLDAAWCTYPDCCQGPDGYIHVTHDHGARDREATILYHRFNEDDVFAGRIVSPRGKIGVVVMRAMASAFNRGLIR